MTNAELITYLRIQVGDNTAPYTHEDPVYQTAIDFALSKLSNDLGELYDAVEDVPFDKEFLLQKLSTIQIYYFLAGTSMGVGGDGPLARIEVPDLEVEEKSAAAGWLSLAQALQREYDDELDNLRRDGSIEKFQAGSSPVNRKSWRTGAWVKDEISEPLVAPTMTAMGLVGKVLLAWSPVRFEDFNGYEIYRAASAEALEYPELSQRLVYIDDPDGPLHGSVMHTYYEDEDLIAGSWFYRLSVLNLNDQRGYSAVVEAVVL